MGETCPQEWRHERGKLQTLNHSTPCIIFLFFHAYRAERFRSTVFRSSRGPSLGLPVRTLTTTRFTPPSRGRTIHTNGHIPVPMATGTRLRPRGGGAFLASFLVVIVSFSSDVGLFLRGRQGEGFQPSQEAVFQFPHHPPSCVLKVFPALFSTRMKMGEWEVGKHPANEFRDFTGLFWTPAQ